MSSDRAATPERAKSRELSREGDDEEISEKYKAFVGGISWHISDRELKDKFREFDATGARVQLDRATGRSRGFGFVMFDDEKGLKAAIAAMHGADLDGRKISVTRAIPQNETQPGTPAAALASGRRGPSGGDRYGARGGYGGSRYGGYGGGYGAPAAAAYGGGYRSDRPYGGGYGGPPPRGYPPDSYGRGGGYGYDDRGYGGGGGYGPGGGYGGYGAPERGGDAYAGGYSREGYGREPGYASGGYGAGSYDRSGYGGGGYSGGGDYGTAPPADRGAYGGSSSYPERYQPDARASAYPPADRARTSYGARDSSAAPR